MTDNTDLFFQPEPFRPTEEQLARVEKHQHSRKMGDLHLGLAWADAKFATEDVPVSLLDMQNIVYQKSFSPLRNKKGDTFLEIIQVGHDLWSATSFPEKPTHILYYREATRQYELVEQNTEIKNTLKDAPRIYLSGDNS